jgi:hypothetical protein
MWHVVKPVTAEVVNTLHSFYGARSFMMVFTTARHWAKYIQSSPSRHSTINLLRITRFLLLCYPFIFSGQ